MGSLTTVKNMLLVPFLQFFSMIQAYLPFDLMGMLGLSAVATVAAGLTFNLDTLSGK